MLANPQQAFGTIVKPSNRRRTVKEFTYLDKRDKQMRFNNGKDPIYYIFDCIENRPVSRLAKEFVEDTIFDVANFVSKVIG